MNEAARLLSVTKFPIAEISEQVGYSNQGKFAAVFKKQFGLLPLEYRICSRVQKTVWSLAVGIPAVKELGKWIK